RTVFRRSGCKRVVLEGRCRQDTRMTKLTMIAAVILVTAIVATSRAQSPAQAQAPVMPRYDNARALILPAEYRRWILAGTSPGLRYAEGAPGNPMFHETLIEPTAYQHFVETGEFRE